MDARSGEGSVPSRGGAATSGLTLLRRSHARRVHWERSRKTGVPAHAGGRPRDSVWRDAGQREGAQCARPAAPEAEGTWRAVREGVTTRRTSAAHAPGRRRGPLRGGDVRARAARNAGPAASCPFNPPRVAKRGCLPGYARAMLTCHPLSVVRRSSQRNHRTAGGKVRCSS